MVEYNTDLFDAATVRADAGAPRACCWRASWRTRSAGSRELPLLGEAERRRLLVEWNDTAAEYPRDDACTQLFEAQAERTPEAPRAGRRATSG